MNKLITIFVTTLLAGCSIVGEAGVESAPYKLLKADKDKETETKIEIREYQSMVLVSTSMDDDGRNSAFRRLFNYIAGDNSGQREIAMTAPVYMGNDAASGEGMKISMTAPVFMNSDVASSGGANVMSFVMPDSFTYDSTPIPNNPKVKVSEVKNYKVAAITFSWTLSDSNVKKHTNILLDYLKQNDFTVTGKAYTAAYNGPMTLPMYRKNEVLIPIQ
ncbi:heme-binding protein [Psychrosphaera haliotis]|uniref:Heme-binding protein n=1 Tax=Psychrosphaera haliotis TaxID=555083 RepID=A0A6N8FBP6_9GAMM|nr:heme-binding protein [Psychrosphaera haliotis]